MLTLKQVEFQLYGALLKLQRLVSGEPSLSSLKESVNDCMDRIQTRRYTIAVVGEFKRGKSSLINAILGMPVLPADVTPTTATINRITFGNEPRVTIRYKDGTEKILDDISELSAYVTKLSEERSRVAASVREAVISYPAIVCQNHVDIIDTPGLGDDEEMTRVTVSILKQIDAAVVVISALSPYDEEEPKFVISLLESREITNIVFVVNYMDQYGEDEYEDVFRAIRSRIIANTMKVAKEHFASRPDLLEKTQRIINESQIFPVSAKQALNAFADNDTKALNDSRIPVFKEQLLSIITKEQCINSVRKSVDLLQDTLQRIRDAQRMELERIKTEGVAERRKRAAKDTFIRDAQRAIDDALFLQLSEMPEFSPSGICEEVMPVFVRRLGTIKKMMGNAEIRRIVAVAASEAASRISEIVFNCKNEYTEGIKARVDSYLSSFPLIQKPDLTQKLYKIEKSYFELPVEHIIPSVDYLGGVDLMSFIRKGVCQDLRKEKEAVDMFFRQQRVAVFSVFDEMIAALKNAPRNDLDLKYEESCRSACQHFESLTNEVRPLLDETESLLDNIIQL